MSYVPDKSRLSAIAAATGVPVDALQARADQIAAGKRDQDPSEPRPLPDFLSIPGHDRDCARAMWNQSRLGPNRYGHDAISTIQVEHLLSIGYRAGKAAAEASVRERVAQRIEQRYEEWSGRASPRRHRDLIAKVGAYCARLAREGDLP